MIAKIEGLGFVSEVEEINGEGSRYILRVKDEKRAKRELPELILRNEAVVTYYDFAEVTLEEVFMETMEEGTK